MNINTQHHQWSLVEMTGDKNPLGGKKGALPLMRVVRKADGEEIMIEPRRFHEALHEVAKPPASAAHLTVTTPLGTSVVEITHEYLEQLTLETIKKLPVSRYVAGYNVADKRTLIAGILTVLGKMGDVIATETLAQKEARLLKEWEESKAGKAEEAPAPTKKSKPVAKKAPAKPETSDED